MKDIKDQLVEYSKLLALTQSISVSESERRASQFLVIMATIIEYRHLFSEQRIEYTSVQTAVYAQEMEKGDAKTVTENKLRAEASSQYVAAREQLERIENDLTYLKTYYELFNNGHLFYRQLAKGEGY